MKKLGRINIKSRRMILAVFLLLMLTISVSVYAQRPGDKNNHFIGNTRTPPGTPNVQVVEDETTPDLSEQPKFNPIKISETIDVSPELKDDDKYVVDIAYPDGTIKEFKVGPLPKKIRTLELPDAVLAKLKPFRQVGDKIIMANLFNKDRIAKTYGATPTATKTPGIKVVPPTLTPIPSKPFPYPAP